MLDELFAWMTLKEAEVLPKSPMAAALRYCLKLEDALRRYATDGRLEIDNNRAERALRQVAVGRNYAESGVMRSCLAEPGLLSPRPEVPVYSSASNSA